MAIEKNIKVTVDTTGAVKEVDNLTTSLDNLGDAGEKSTDRYSGAIRKSNPLVEKLNAATGGLANSFLDVGDAAKKAGVGMKAALISSGIGIAVVALGLIVEHWESIVNFVQGTNDSLELQNQKLDSQLKNVRLRVSENELLEKSLTAQGKSTDDILKAKDKLLQAEQFIILAKIENLRATRLEAIEEAKKLNVLEQYLNLLATGSRGQGTGIISEEDQLEIDEFNNQILELNNSLVNLGIQRDALANPDRGKKEVKKKADKKKDDTKIDFDDSALKVLETETRKLEQLAQIRQDFADRNRDNQLAQLEIDRERKVDEINELIEDEIFKEQALLEVNKFYDGEEAKLRDANKLANEKAAEDVAKTEQEQRQRTHDFTVALAGQTLDIIGNLAKEGSELSKGVAVAQAIQDTYKGAVAAYAAGSSVGGPAGLVLGPIAAGLAVVAGLTNIKKILATKPIETSAPGGSGGGGGGRAPAAPSFNLVQGTASNQIADSLQSQNAPVKAFVVSSDVTTSQELDRNIVRDNSLQHIC